MTTCDAAFHRQGGLALARALCLLILLALGGAVVPWSALAAEAPRILRLESSAELDASGAFTVTETLTAMTPGGHGLYRDVPFAVRMPWGAMYRIPPQVLEAELDGRPCPVDDVQRDGDVLRIYIRDTGRTLPPGRHVFRVVYRLPHMVGFYDQHDALNWNAVGAGWDMPVEKAVYRLRLPAGASVLEARGWQGVQGSTDHPLTGRALPGDADGRPGVEFRSEEALASGQGMTCLVTWNKGLVTEPQRPQKTLFAGRWPMENALALLAALLVWLYYPLIWWRTGRDPAGEIIIPRFYPPMVKNEKGKPQPMSPAAVSFLSHDNELAASGLCATFLHMATTGACTIAGDSKAGFVLRQTTAPCLYPEETAIRAMQGKDPLVLNTKSAELLIEMREKVQTLLGVRYGSLWRSNIWWVAVGMLLQVLLAASVLVAGLGWFDEWSDEALAGLVGGGLVLMYLPFWCQQFWQGLSRRRWWLATQWLGLMLVLLLVAFILLEGESDSLLQAASPFFWLCLLLTLSAHGCFAPIMDAPTLQGRTYKDHIKGLALYIRTAETDRFRQWNPPDRTPEVFTRLLPYAVALGLEEAWGENCAKVLEGALAMRHADLYSHGFALSLSRTMSSAMDSVGGSRSGGSSSSGVGSGGGGGGGGFC